MALIFFLSAQPDLSSGLGVWDLILRKFAHAGAYALLTLLWFRALAPLTGHALIAAVVIQQKRKPKGEKVTTEKVERRTIKEMVVARGGIEPPTRGFSVRCSTD